MPIGRFTYDFNVKTMQQINQGTLVTRPIRRVNASSSKVKRAVARASKPKRSTHRHNFGFNVGSFGGMGSPDPDSQTEVIKVTSEDKQDEGDIEMFVSVELTEDLLKGEEQCRLCLL
eukprot:TRINITY_DN3102_c0_g1_i3.p2 TRINITY_DN3102_c0_g1~~TRINITY_DN3102_c0_g1_i3.p2  ORF type:complete len:117 (-),score=17.43 TRINITY_DN3102_c0_g1_i3:687-1037(-)